jgi:hypothetical protein
MQHTNISGLFTAGSKDAGFKGARSQEKNSRSQGFKGSSLPAGRQGFKWHKVNPVVAETAMGKPPFKASEGG